MLTGQPCTQVGFLQLRQRWDSVMACSKERPWLTSSWRDLTRTSGRSSGICTRGMATRSLGFPSKGSTCISERRSSDGRATVERRSCPMSELCETPLYFSIASASSALKAFIRLSISFQSTPWASNSGPSTQTNLVLPCTVTRQAPHIPVPSTMIVLSDASVGMLYLAVVSATNFIMIAGPMVIHLSTCSRLITCSTPTVTTPCWPAEPSSVMMITSSDHCANSSCRMSRSLLRAARTVMTLLPAFLSASAIGNIGAAPTPPANDRAVFLNTRGATERSDYIVQALARFHRQ